MNSTREIVIRIPVPQFRRPQWSLKKLIVGITVATMLMGFLGARIHRSRVQQRAVSHVFRTGGSVCYSGSVHYRMHAGGRITFASSTNPPGGYPDETFLRSTLGTDFFDTVTSVTIGERGDQASSDPVIVAQAFASLVHLPGLRRIYIKDINAESVDLTALTRLSELTKITFTGRFSNDQLFEQLRRELPNCQIIDRSDSVQQ